MNSLKVHPSLLLLCQVHLSGLAAEPILASVTTRYTPLSAAHPFDVQPICHWRRRCSCATFDPCERAPACSQPLTARSQSTRTTPPLGTPSPSGTSGSPSSAGCRHAVPAVHKFRFRLPLLHAARIRAADRERRGEGWMGGGGGAVRCGVSPRCRPGRAGPRRIERERV